MTVIETCRMKAGQCSLTRDAGRAACRASRLTMRRLVCQDELKEGRPVGASETRLVDENGRLPEHNCPRDALNEGRPDDRHRDVPQEGWPVQPNTGCGTCCM